MLKYRILNPYSFALIIMVFLLPSCKDWLTIAPEDSLVKEKFWQKREDVEGALAATYDAFRDQAQSSFIQGELRADMVKFGDQFGDYNLIAKSDISPSNSTNSYSGYYKAINYANTLMYYDKQVFKKDKTLTQEILNGIDAEALFVRSLSYFYLVRLWKDIPLVIEPSLSDTSATYFLPKSEEKVVLHQIIADLLKAKNMAYKTQFRNDPDHPRYFCGRANKYSIMSLLADVYLWDQQYQNCINYCDSVSNSGLYSLAPSDTWFNIYNPGNSKEEGIFEIQYDDNLVGQENPAYDGIFLRDAVQATMTTNYTALMGSGDLRSCGTNGPIWKYVGIDVNSTTKRTRDQRDGHFIYYRYADILLMKAEALCELDKLSDANLLVREISDRASGVFSAADSKSSLRLAILDERAREFTLEGKRWFDVLRVAKRNHFANKDLIINMLLAGADIQQQAVLRTKVYDTMSYYLPIPEREIQYNPNLVQNPFYDR